MPEKHRLIVWAEAEQAPLVERVIAHGEIDLAGVGGESSAAAGALATALQSESLHDLRQAIQRDDVDALWVAAPVELDRPTIRLIHQTRLPVVSSQPQPGSLAGLMDAPEEAASVRFVPLMRRSAGYRAAREVFGDFGPVECVNVSFRSGPAQGTLFSRLFDAMDLVDTLCDEADLMDAALAAPTGRVPETLAGLHGHLTVNMRFPENRCACVAASDRAGSWFRGVTVLGAGGCLRIHDDGFEWIDRHGRQVDSHQSAEPCHVGDLIAQQIHRLLRQMDSSESPPQTDRIMAICEAARLSCRTGEGEAPRKMLKMLSRP